MKKLILYPLAVACGCVTLAAVAAVGVILWAHHHADNDSGPFGQLPEPPQPDVNYVERELERINRMYHREARRHQMAAR